MLGENIKNIRMKKGFTQEELALRLNVVRQTVSKWEQNRSVPDAALLQQLAETLDCPVTELLGSPAGPEPEQNALVEQLARINEQLAVRNRRSKRIWKAVIVVLLCLTLLPTLLGIAGLTLFRADASRTMQTSMTVSEEGPYAQREVEEAMSELKRDFPRLCPGGELRGLDYDEALTQALPDSLFERYGVKELLLLTADFRTGGKLKIEGLAPDASYTGCPWLLGRSAGGDWIVLAAGENVPTAEK